jgi:HEAT repeat protein
VGSAAALAVPGLIQLLPDRDGSVREAASDALAGVGAPAVELLARVIEERDRRLLAEYLRLRIQMAEWAGRLPTDEYNGITARPLEALNNVMWYFRTSDESGPAALHAGVAEVLGRIGPAASPAAAALAGLLSSDDARCRRCAARALGQIGPRAGDPLFALLPILSDPVESVRKAAASALEDTLVGWRYMPQTTKEAARLLAALDCGDGRAAPLLEAFAVIGAPATPLLAEAVRKSGRVVRRNAAVALGRIGPDARDAVSALQSAAASDDNNFVREAAAEALKRVTVS